ncbi:MAG: TonB-dependent siderophore receptor, partial [Novosphingobium sp.]
MTKHTALRTFLASSVAILALPTTANAQTSNEASSENSIVVTGLRQQYRGDVPLKELPQSVQVLDNKQLSTLNITRLDA